MVQWKLKKLEVLDTYIYIDIVGITYSKKFFAPCLIEQNTCLSFVECMKFKRLIFVYTCRKLGTLLRDCRSSIMVFFVLHYFSFDIILLDV